MYLLIMWQDLTLMQIVVWLKLAKTSQMSVDSITNFNR